MNRFRIKLSDAATGRIVYDNQVGTDDAAELDTAGTLVQSGSMRPWDQSRLLDNIMWVVVSSLGVGPKQNLLIQDDGYFVNDAETACSQLLARFLNRK